MQASLVASTNGATGGARVGRGDLGMTGGWEKGAFFVQVIVLGGTQVGGAQSLAGVLRRKQVIQWMDRATGMVFVLFAARLALSRR